MKIRLHEYNLPLTHPFTISRGTITVQGTLIVELQQDGVSGYGEATVNAYYDAALADMKKRFTAMEPVLAAHTFRDTDSFWNLCAEHLDDAPFVLAALDCAAHDLWGRLENAPVHRLWGLDPNDAVNSSFTIGIAEVDMMIAGPLTLLFARDSSADRVITRPGNPKGSCPSVINCQASLSKQSGCRLKTSVTLIAIGLSR